jgi:hypothetical protein
MVLALYLLFLAVDAWLYLSYTWLHRHLVGLARNLESETQVIKGNQEMLECVLGFLYAST